MNRFRINVNDATKVKLAIAYTLWVIGAWTLYKFILLNNDTHLSPFSNETLRFLVFMGPILIFIAFNVKQPWYRWLGLYGCKKNSIHKTIITAFFYATISTLINMYVFHKQVHLSAISPTFLLTTFSFSIIMEEIAFRGFLFYLFEKLNKNAIVVATSLAFAIKHIPGWLLFPSEISTVGCIGDFFMVFLVGSILGYLYLATHSIWATSLVHSINNLIVALFS